MRTREYQDKPKDATNPFIDLPENFQPDKLIVEKEARSFKPRPFRIRPEHDLPATDSGWWVPALAHAAPKFGRPTSLNIPPPTGWLRPWAKTSNGLMTSVAPREMTWKYLANFESQCREYSELADQVEAAGLHLWCNPGDFLARAKEIEHIFRRESRQMTFPEVEHETESGIQHQEGSHDYEKFPVDARQEDLAPPMQIEAVPRATEDL